MKLRTLACLIGALAISSAPFVLAVSGGGLPSFPRFTAVGVGTAAPSTAGVINAATDVQVNGVTLTGQATTNASNLTSGTLADARLSSNIPLKNGANIFTAQQTINTGGANNFIVQTNASSFAEVIAQDGGTTNGILLCMSDAANICGNSIPGGDAVIRWTSSSGTALLHFDGGALGNIDEATLSSSGVFNAKSGGDLQVNSVSMCRSDGTNCPSATSTATSSATSVGCTAALGATFRYVKSGSLVVVSIDPFQCTSNSTAFSFTSAVPAAMQPARNQYCAVHVNDNAINQIGLVQFSAGSSTAQLWTGNTAAGAWTASGGKGLGFGNGSCSYLLN